MSTDNIENLRWALARLYVVGIQSWARPIVRWLNDRLPKRHTATGLSSAFAYAAVDLAYAKTRARLADDPKWLELKAAAAKEAAETPEVFLARNMESIYLELNTP